MSYVEITQGKKGLSEHRMKVDSVCPCKLFVLSFQRIILQSEDDLRSKPALKAMTAVTQQSEQARQYVVDNKGIYPLICMFFICLY